MTRLRPDVSPHRPPSSGARGRTSPTGKRRQEDKQKRMKSYAKTNCILYQYISSKGERRRDERREGSGSGTCAARRVELHLCWMEHPVQGDKPWIANRDLRGLVEKTGGCGVLLGKRDQRFRNNAQHRRGAYKYVERRRQVYKGGETRAAVCRQCSASVTLRGEIDRDPWPGNCCS